MRFSPLGSGLRHSRRTLPVCVSMPSAFCLCRRTTGLLAPHHYNCCVALPRTLRERAYGSLLQTRWIQDTIPPAAVLPLYAFAFIFCLDAASAMGYACNVKAVFTPPNTSWDNARIPFLLVSLFAVRAPPRSSLPLCLPLRVVLPHMDGCALPRRLPADCLPARIPLEYSPIPHVRFRFAALTYWTTLVAVRSYLRWFASHLPPLILRYRTVITLTRHWCRRLSRHRTLVYARLRLMTGPPLFLWFLPRRAFAGFAAHLLLFYLCLLTDTAARCRSSLRTAP